MSAVPVNNTQTITRNTFWYGLELTFGVFGAFVTSILVARAIGPERLGNFNTVWWLTNVTTTVGMLGMPTTAGKYMAEHLNKGEPGLAKAIYAMALRLQVIIAAVIVGCSLIAVFLLSDRDSRWFSTLLVLSIAPRMIGSIPSRANTAAETSDRNTRPALVAGTLNILLTLLSLWVGWDLIGIAAAFAATSAFETFLKARGVSRRLRPVPRVPIPPELKRRMAAYSGQGIVLVLLYIVVWDRSDLLILKALNPDIRQVTFFTIAFNLTERLLMFPAAFSSGVHATIMAQYGRGRERLEQLATTAVRYVFLLAIPPLVGIASLSGKLIPLLYGSQYEPLVPVLRIAAVLGISKALMTTATALLQATENQSWLIWTGCICGALDIALDVVLTPAHGAAGAAMANGLAQTLAMILVWLRVRQVLGIRLPVRALARIAVSAVAMAAVVLAAGRLVPNVRGLMLQVVLGAVVWLVMLRMTRALRGDDRERLAQMGRILPARLRPVLERLTAALVCPW